MTERRIVHAVVRGRVQGVGFRAWTRARAERDGLEGWVRNRRDGAVEAVLAGAPEAVEQMLDALREGPRGCRVEDVAVEEAGEGDLAQRGRPGGFGVLPTA
jgi:acylphosphatase